jgi:hypothetical protein
MSSRDDGSRDRQHAIDKDILAAWRETTGSHARSVREIVATIKSKKSHMVALCKRAVSDSAAIILAGFIDVISSSVESARRTFAFNRDQFDLVMAQCQIVLK